jgi:DHA2 family multidrug resistance protein
LGSLSAIVQREANTLAYIDGFWLTVWFAIAGLVLVALIGRSPAGPFTPTSNPGWLLRRLRQAFAR